MFSYGDRGPEVQKLQQSLLKLGYQLPQFGDDGDYGNETATAVRAFQRENGLPQTGIVDTQTYNKLMGISPATASPNAVSVKTSPITRFMETVGPYQKYIMGAVALGFIAYMATSKKKGRA